MASTGAIAISRRTKETDITLTLSIYGSGESRVDTGIPFFDHMLGLFARHGLLDLELNARGDTAVDFHHTVEDVGLCLGEALRRAAGDKAGLSRYGSALIPMDEALAQVALDLSGRPYLAFNVSVPGEQVGAFPAELAEEFCRALANAGGLTLHLDLIRGSNGHHILESLFKALGRAVKAAFTAEPRLDGSVWSTKGSL